MTTIIPQRIAAAFIQVGMKNEEVADAFHLLRHQTIILFRRRSITRLLRKQGPQFSKTTLDKVNGHRFQRFEEASRKPDRDNIAVPHLASAAGAKTYQPRLAQQTWIDALHALRFRISVGQERARTSQSGASKRFVTHLVNDEPRRTLCAEALTRFHSLG